jgi:hypothetical protein
MFELALLTSAAGALLVALARLFLGVRKEAKVRRECAAEVQAERALLPLSSPDDSPLLASVTKTAREEARREGYC